MMAKMRIPVYLLTVLFGLFICLTGNLPAWAQTDDPESVDKIIQGFDDEAPARQSPDAFMDGFEETSVPPPATPVGEDEFLQGFDEAPAEESAALTESKEPSAWRLEGEFALTSTYNFSPEAEPPWRGFSMLRSELEVAVKNKISDRWQAQISVRGFYDAVFSIRGRDNYTSQVLDQYETELELKDTFIQGSLTDDLDTKIGRQVVVWGTLDNLRVTDVLNPLDLRVPGMTDIDDLRLPVTMLKFDYYFSKWALSGIALPEVRFSKLPVYGSDFYPFPVPRPPEDSPDSGFENVQYAGALTGVFSGWDIGFYGASIYADQSYAELVAPLPSPQFVRKHARVTMFGTAGNVAVGNWLLKAEAAWFDGLRYTNIPGTDYTRLDLGAGVEYSGFSETTVSLEAANRHLFDYNPSLEQPPDEIRENEFQWALRFNRDFLNDTLTLTLLASTFGIKADDGAFERLDAEYDITDAVSIRGGVVLYQAGDKGLFQDVGGNDRLFVILKFNF